MREQIKTLKNQGLNNRKIAAQLGICASTVTYHLREDYRQRKAVNLKKNRASSKSESITYKGGKCQICSYDRCPSALEFHHLDPKQKDPKINASLSKFSFESIKTELDKCVLVCCRCHREIHAGLIKP